jgi:lipoate-protein ligase A
VQKDIISFISRFLNHPPAEPEYRKNRSHDEFLMNLPDTFDLSGFYNSLLSQFKQYTGTESTLCPAPIRHEIIQRARRKAAQMYARPDWILDGQVAAMAAINPKG